MKKTLLSILFAIMLVAGLLGTLLESAMIYDRFTGEKITLEYAFCANDRKVPYDLAKVIVDYLEKNDVETLKKVCNRRDIRFAVYTYSGTPVGRNMSSYEELGSLYYDYHTEKGEYRIKLDVGTQEDRDVNRFLAKGWTFIKAYTYREVIFGVASVVLLIGGIALLVFFGLPIVKYLVFVLLILTVLVVVAIAGGSHDYDELFTTAVAVLIILTVVGAYYIKKISNLEKAVKEIADGNTDCKINTKKYPISLKNFAGNINHISDSVYNAVNERLKSERFKTELITNVSHDIKTPLTSIINFSDLIVKEGTTEEERIEYADHLHKQSVRLKELLEALIEASKAATGAVELNMAPCDVHVLLEQCVVEYEHKLNLADISLMESYPEEKLMISADAKFLSRIFENLLTNICKYAMPGSRAYVSAKKLDNNAVISFKNMSKEPLNFTMEELTERFVRGDISRHTEGHGLGLSIVKSLMDLQNGELKMQADADLFIVELSFPLTEIESEEIATEETGQ